MQAISLGNAAWIQPEYASVNLPNPLSPGVRLKDLDAIPECLDPCHGYVLRILWVGVLYHVWHTGVAGMVDFKATRRLRYGSLRCLAGSSCEASQLSMFGLV